MYISVFQLLELCFGRQEKEGAVGKDLHRITKMNKKTQEVRKNFMKKKGTVRKGYIDKEHEQNGVESYMGL